jgi:hypothetical protein
LFLNSCNTVFSVIFVYCINYCCSIKLSRKRDTLKLSFNLSKLSGFQQAFRSPRWSFANAALFGAKTVGLSHNVSTNPAAFTAVTSVENLRLQLLHLQCLVFQQPLLCPLLRFESTISVDSASFFSSTER